MQAGGFQSAGFKVCPQCHRQTDLGAQTCGACGHVFRQQFAGPGSVPPPQAPPHGQPGTNPTQAYFAANTYAYGPADLTEMARRFNDSRKTCVWTFWVGWLFMPLWILTVIEYQRMRDLKDTVARMGVNVQWWMQTYYLRDVI